MKGIRLMRATSLDTLPAFMWLERIAEQGVAYEGSTVERKHAAALIAHIRALEEERVSFTPWFPWWTLPLRRGVYEVRLDSNSERWFRHWDGVGWRCGGRNILEAKQYVIDGGIYFRNTSEWRGLARKPG